MFHFGIFALIVFDDNTHESTRKLAHRTVGSSFFLHLFTMSTKKIDRQEMNIKSDENNAEEEKEEKHDPTYNKASVSILCYKLNLIYFIILCIC